MKLKKLFGILLIVTLMVAITACGTADDSSTDPADETTAGYEETQATIEAETSEPEDNDKHSEDDSSDNITATEEDINLAGVGSNNDDSPEESNEDEDDYPEGLNSEIDDIFNKE